jgi:hypothetical protein
MPCAEDVAKDGAKKAASKLDPNKLFANPKNTDSAGKEATDTTKGASITHVFGFTNPANPSSAGDNKVDAKGKANQGNTNADGSVAVQKSSLNDPKNAGAASGQLNGGNPIADKFTPSIATPNGTPSKVDAIGNKKQGVTDAQKNANGADDNKFLFSATADDRTPADSNNAALSQTGKASKDKEANETVWLNKGDKIGAKGDANANQFGTEGSGSKVGTQGNTVGVTAQKPGEQSSEKGVPANRNDFPPSTGDASRLLSSTNPPNTSSDRTAADTTIPLDNATKGAVGAQGKAKGTQGSAIGNQPGAAAPKLGEQAKSDTKVAEGSVDSAAGHQHSSAQGNNAAGPAVSVLNGNTNVGYVEGLQSNVGGDNNSGKQAGKANGGKKGDDC